MTQRSTLKSTQSEVPTSSKTLIDHPGSSTRSGTGSGVRTVGLNLDLGSVK